MTTTYRSDNATEEAFLSTLIIAACSFICIDLLYLIPALWLIFVFQQSFTPRVLLATLIAIAVGAIVYLILYFYSPQTISDVDFSALIHRSSWTPSTLTLPYLGALLVTVCFMVFAVSGFSSENVSIQTYITISGIPLIVFDILSFFPTQDSPYIYELILATLGIFATHFFLSKQNVARGVTFLIFILAVFTYRLLDYAYTNLTIT